jgi:hypothetical protein
VRQTVDDDPKQYKIKNALARIFAQCIFLLITVRGVRPFSPEARADSSGLTLAHAAGAGRAPAVGLAKFTMDWRGEHRFC